MTSSIEDVIGRLTKWLAKPGRCWGASVEAEQARDIEALLTAYARSQEALRPFARTVEVDIGSDESDAVTFRNCNREYALAPLITVGDLRRASLAFHGDGGGKEDQGSSVASRGGTASPKSESDGGPL